MLNQTRTQLGEGWRSHLLSKSQVAPREVEAILREREATRRSPELPPGTPAPSSPSRCLREDHLHHGGELAS